MAKNAFLEQQRKLQEACFREGLRVGRQQIMDMLSLALHDPEYVGKDIFGKDRLVKLSKGIEYYLHTYSLAWAKHDETDYYRDKLDKALAEIYGPGLADNFMVRYENAMEFDYSTGKWKTGGKK